ncbi:metalloregulator ArsR/SmtB family transcription factor [Saccharopolyspora sp. NPDC047091]|uniref:helix-turn-helix domain-containing GNAT family N-acetyltransferase n=1 Tax=Saccharopolyspora sp. NPDC047091 TaxID=3155924 RepID=UPI0033F631AC
MTDPAVLPGAAAFFGCLADPTRLRLLHAVAADGPSTVGELARRLGIGQSTCSHHLRRLAAAELVVLRERGSSTSVAVGTARLTGAWQVADLLLGLVPDAGAPPSTRTGPDAGTHPGAGAHPGTGTPSGIGTPSGTGTSSGAGTPSGTGTRSAAGTDSGAGTDREARPSAVAGPAATGPADPLVRPLDARDWDAVRRIYAEGIATGSATFETEVPAAAELDGKWPPEHRWVAELDGELAGWAALTPVSARRCYAGVAEVSIYVAAAARGRGVGGLLLDRQVRAADDAGLWTLQSVIFPENRACLALHHAAGFRTVGVRERIGMLRGRWRNTVLVERRRPGPG